jgi:hypothetical protein
MVQKMRGGQCTLAGKKNESWNFQEWFAQECFSAHGKLEYDVSSGFVFGPALIGNAPEPPPIGLLGIFFNSINSSV